MKRIDEKMKSISVGCCQANNRKQGNHGTEEMHSALDNWYAEDLADQAWTTYVVDGERGVDMGEFEQMNSSGSCIQEAKCSER